MVDEKKTCTLQEIAQMAIGCQNACNASGLVHSMSEKIMPSLWAEARDGTGRGTDWVNCHPVMILFLNKLSDLAGVFPDASDKFRWAWERCEAYAQGENVKQGEIY